MKAGERSKQKILDAGVAIWASGRQPTVQAIADMLSASRPGVVYHFGTAHGLREAVARHAVQCGDSRVITQLVAIGHHSVASMSEAERVSHLRAITSYKVTTCRHSDRDPSRYR